MAMTASPGMAWQRPEKWFIIMSLKNYGNGGNYISSIKPDESVQLNMAWIVNENDLENLYLNVTGDGASYEFSEIY